MLELKDTDKLSIETRKEKWIVEGEGSWYAKNGWTAELTEKRQLFADGRYSRYSIPPTNHNIRHILKTWKGEQIDYVDELSKLKVREYVLKQTQFSLNAKYYAAFKEHQAIPKFDFVEHPNPDLHMMPHQKMALYLLLSNESYALPMQQGTGKTLPCIRLICSESAKTSNVYKALVVCPNNVRQNWQEEMQLFTTNKGIVQIIDGTELERLEQLLDPVKYAKADPDIEWIVYVVSYDTLSRMANFIKGAAFNFDLGVLDESHYIKSSKTNRWKAVKVIRSICSKRVWLTGTPINNTIMDLFTQLEWLEEGASGFTTLTGFKNFFGKWDSNGKSGYARFTGVQNLPVLQTILTERTFDVRLREVMPDLPKVSYDLYEVEMTNVQAEAYKQMQQQLVVQARRIFASTDNKLLAANNILTQMLRLAQITSGYISWTAQEDEEGNILEAEGSQDFEPNPKIKAVKEILAQREPDSKTIIWACFRQNIFLLKKELEEYNPVTYFGDTNKDARNAAIASFNLDPACRVFIGNPVSGGTGVNLLGFDKRNPDILSTNADLAIYYSQNWSASARDQSEKRNFRKGTRVPVHYTDLVVPKSIDLEIRDRVRGKIRDAKNIQNVKALLESLLGEAL